MTAPVLRAAHVRRTPAEAFALFTDDIGAWWPLATHGVYGDGGTVGFEGDRLVERSADGEESVWASVTAWEPGGRLVLEWHPGRTSDDATEVEVLFLADDAGTRVEVLHRGWDRFGAKAERMRRTYGGPHAWGTVLDHYTAVADVVESDDLVVSGCG